ncbi:MAG: BhlA/UviB family holin-like peptide [Clostridium chrysemydis]|uniref:BhlA/UviB family holin-like peptide n=1 Tax=Clostridium TaxID=1485 RepID=UPI0021522805|nr:BhlA/UviB family holin-like peptide [Clostridium sp. LY3-2]MCR6516336.1 BhlA/UviB family holin-like peptide [Clostridium sp. LY3-2]
MEKELLTQIVGQGAFAALFVWLLWDTRKEARDREAKLYSTIDKNHEIINDLAKKFNVVEDIKEDVDIIKDHLFNN